MENEDFIEERFQIQILKIELEFLIKFWGLSLANAPTEKEIAIAIDRINELDDLKARVFP